MVVQCKNKDIAPFRVKFFRQKHHNIEKGLLSIRFYPLILTSQNALKPLWNKALKDFDKILLCLIVSREEVLRPIQALGFIQTGMKRYIKQRFWPDSNTHLLAHVVNLVYHLFKLFYLFQALKLGFTLL